MVQSWSILVEVALWLTLNSHSLFFAAAAAATVAAADAVAAVAAVVAAVAAVPLWRVAALQSVAL